MAGEARRERTFPELDQELLASPFEHMTNWHVITGAPSCGKTTLVDLLTQRGFPTVEECARRYLEGELSSGHTIDEIHTHGAALQRRLLAIKMRIEAELQPSDVAFLDCAVPGSIAWYRLFGLDPNDALRHCFRHRYASVFVLDPLPLTPDGVRFEDDAFTGFLDEWIARDYEALGYHVVRVPVLAPDDRLAYLLERVPTHALDTP
jgi:predicted ATPase